MNESPQAGAKLCKASLPVRNLIGGYQLGMNLANFLPGLSWVAGNHDNRLAHNWTQRTLYNWCPINGN